MTQPNTLFYGDNLPVLREYIATESIDLVYLDPPFNSSRSYNVLFKDERGQEADAQITAFEDTWHWNQKAEETYFQLLTQGDEAVARMIEAMHGFIGANQMMAYLVMMAARLVELHRVLKPTGSLYLHCDPTASHYLKVVLDTIFGVQNYRNEITWKRSAAHNDTKQGMDRYGRIRDVILFYTKSKTYFWNPQYTAYDQEYLQSEYRHRTSDGRHYKETDLTAAKPGGDTEYEWFVKRRANSESRWQADLEEEYRNPVIGWEYRSVRPYKGRYWAYSKQNLQQFWLDGHLIHRDTGMPRLVQYADEMPGVALQDLWCDLPPAMGNEALGYPTQKPVALLERILQASSNPGDLVLDPFCGCGTTIAAAQKLGRRWLGIDITHLSIALQKYRLKDAFGLVAGKDYLIKGEPVDHQSAVQLAQDDRYQFQWWALSLIQARPVGAGAGGKTGKKGADSGIDGVITFVDDSSGKAKRAIVQVKSGGVKVGDVRDLAGVIEREKAALGIFLTLEAPSKPMLTEAVQAGFYHSPGWNQAYPRLQIATIQQLLDGATLKLPPSSITFKTAEKAGGKDDSQLGLFRAK